MAKILNTGVHLVLEIKSKMKNDTFQLELYSIFRIFY